eukprot:m.2400 g.2400  ORF g.2400 m.2400 type:complete len:224 (-) comp1777_c0_seq1:208-879(-)
MEHIISIKHGEHLQDENAIVDDAVRILAQGGVVAVPTDTLYGVAALAQSKEGIEKLYAIKGRDEKKPIAVCVHSTKCIEEIADITVSMDLINSLLPGPVTIILPRKPSLNPNLNPHTPLIGIRVLEEESLTNVLASKLNAPIALTSANRSGKQSCIAINEFAEIHGDLDKVYDAGTIHSSGKCRLGSTVVDLSIEGKYKIIRDGSALVKTEDVLIQHGLQREE